MNVISIKYELQINNKLISNPIVKQQTTNDSLLNQALVKT